MEDDPEQEKIDEAQRRLVREIADLARGVNLNEERPLKKDRDGNQLQFGGFVEISGFVQKANFNGARGIICERTDCDRFHVRLLSNLYGFKLNYVKPENLRSTSPPRRMTGVARG